MTRETMMKRETLMSWRRAFRKFSYHPSRSEAMTLLDSNIAAHNIIERLTEGAPVHDVQHIIAGGIRNYAASEGTARTFHREGGSADDVLRTLDKDSQSLADYIYGGLIENGFTIVKLDPPRLNLDTADA